MKSNNFGNIKLVSLLFLLGCSSAVLLIPAVVQKETISSATGNVIGKKDQQSDQSDSLMAKAQNIKKEYIEVPVVKVVETTNEITKYIKEPQKIISSEETKPRETLGNSISNTSPQAVMTITKEMVDNCRIITDQYNKVIK